MPFKSSQVWRSGNHGNYGRVYPTGLIVQYELQNPTSYNGTGTTVTDLRGNSNATLVASPTWPATGARSLEFNGSTQYLITNTSLNSKLNPANTSSVISVFVWVYMMDNGCIVSEQGTTTPDTNWYDSQIERKAGALCFSVWPYTAGSPNITSSIATNLNTWYYVGFTYDGTTLRAYVDGSLAGSSTYARQTPYVNGAGVGLYYTLGYGTKTNMTNATQVGDFANMRFGAFHVYNIALSESTIRYNFDNSRTIYGR